MLLPPEKQKLLEDISSDLQKIDNISAIVLGGSYSTGRANYKSDLDIGIYYHENHPFSIDEIKLVAKKYAIEKTPVITDFYEWGPWVNGGAWIETSAGKVDFLYRNINQVRRTIQNAQDGIWENNFDQQPPYGFSSIFYLAEIENCFPQYDPQNILIYLKSLIKTYPEPLKKTIIQDSLWSAEFSIKIASQYANNEDYYNTFGCFSRTLKSLVNCLFALNEVYPIGDKNALEILENLSICPKRLEIKTIDILTPKKSLTSNLELLNNLFNEVISLSKNIYQPKFKL